ncbi:hypothetical protein [Garciella nitratireducens]|uniref:hypothetical protein n=1 Tax=Garciella nitratireducens TaxID=218205 RepID=UPI000DE96F22|nr:hypothetical protein [Garciella nitratireducens]
MGSVEIEVAEVGIDILPLLNCSKFLIIFFIKIGYWIFFWLTLRFVNTPALFEQLIGGYLDAAVGIEKY